MEQQLNKDEEYLDIILNAIRVCAGYRPKLGHGKKEGYSLREFQELYRNDPFYNWVGLNSPLMYTAHKTAGGMTSIYRQIGIGCEVLFRKIIMDSLSLNENDVKWSYSVKREDGKTRTLSLDARIPVDTIPDTNARTRIQKWIAACAEDLEISPRIASVLQGIVFEVRQGYKSKDSKRQNADIANAAAAYTQGYLPVRRLCLYRSTMALFCVTGTKNGYYLPVKISRNHRMSLFTLSCETLSAMIWLLFFSVIPKRLKQ